jgi:hypothetical protein
MCLQSSPPGEGTPHEFFVWTSSFNKNYPHSTPYFHSFFTHKKSWPNNCIKYNRDDKLNLKRI